MQTVRVIVMTLVAMLGINSLAQDAPAAPAAPGRGGPGGRGNWDPAQMQERMLTYQKEQLGINEQDWEAIKPLVTAVMEKQRAVRELQSRGFGGRGRGDDRAQNPQVEAVSKAIESNDADAVKKALDELRAARKVKEAELKAAQDALREVLTVQQEAKLVLAGTLD